MSSAPTGDVSSAVERDVAAPPPPGVPGLAVLPLSDSFATAWSELARESGLSLQLVHDALDFCHMADAVGVICVAGLEDELEPLLRRIAPAAVDIAAVGALSDHRLAIGALQAGATDYFALPQDYDLLRSWLRDRADRLHSRLSRSQFAAKEEAKYRFEGILGESLPLRRALRAAARIIPHANVTVLITGETGTGKELLARAIHYNSPRREAPFVDINCAAIPEQLLESELFGHEKGAFTDATSAKPGLFEVAHGGTLFLDEIGHLPLIAQGKLLRALEERVVRRVGGTRSVPIDVRVIAATHVDLAAAVRAGRFREDLYYRLNIIPLELPPLRQRQDDILPLVRHFLSRFAREYGLRVPTLTPSAERTLLIRPWPGNIRELRNAVERALLLSGSAQLDASDFALDSTNTQRPPPGSLPFPATVREITRAAAIEMLDLFGGNKSEAARQLGISRSRLNRLLDAGADHDNASPGVGQ